LRSLEQHSDQSAKLAELRERAERDFPETWKPSDGDRALAGEFVRLDQGHTAYGPASIAVIRTEDGRERSLWLLHAALKAQFGRARPRAGELVVVKYEGKKTSAAGQSYESYRVVLDREREAPNWDALAAEAEQPDELAETPPFETDTDGFDKPEPEDDNPNGPLPF
jgi:hypothetical protein